MFYEERKGVCMQIPSNLPPTGPAESSNLSPKEVIAQDVQNLSTALQDPEWLNLWTESSEEATAPVPVALAKLKADIQNPAFSSVAQQPFVPYFTALDTFGKNVTGIPTFTPVNLTGDTLEQAICGDPPGNITGQNAGLSLDGLINLAKTAFVSGKDDSIMKAILSSIQSILQENLTTLTNTLAGLS